MTTLSTTLILMSCQMTFFVTTLTTKTVLRSRCICRYRSRLKTFPTTSTSWIASALTSPWKEKAIGLFSTSAKTCFHLSNEMFFVDTLKQPPVPLFLEAFRDKCDQPRILPSLLQTVPVIIPKMSTVIWLVTTRIQLTFTPFTFRILKLTDPQSGEVIFDVFLNGSFKRLAAIEIDLKCFIRRVHYIWNWKKELKADRRTKIEQRFGHKNGKRKNKKRVPLADKNRRDQMSPKSDVPEIRCPSTRVTF